MTEESNESTAEASTETESSGGGLADNLNLSSDQVDKPEVDSRETTEVVRDSADTTLSSKPEGIPDELWDDTAKDIKKTALVDDYLKSQKRIGDLRKTISRGIGGEPAEKVDDYKVEFSEDVKQFVPEDDKALATAKEAALEAGIPVEMFDKFTQKYMGGLLEKGLIAAPQSEEEINKLHAIEDKKAYDEQLRILGDDGKRTLDKVSDRISTLYKKGSLTDEDLAAYKNAAFDAKGVLFMEKIMSLPTNSIALNIPTQHAVSEGSLTLEQLDAMAGDARASDPAFRKRRSDGYAALPQHR